VSRPNADDLAGILLLEGGALLAGAARSSRRTLIAAPPIAQGIDEGGRFGAGDVPVTVFVGLQKTVQVLGDFTTADLAVPIFVERHQAIDRVVFLTATLRCPASALGLFGRAEATRWRLRRAAEISTAALHLLATAAAALTAAESALSAPGTAELVVTAARAATLTALAGRTPAMTRTGFMLGE
jgi:hypothetical protein